MSSRHIRRLTHKKKKSGRGLFALYLGSSVFLMTVLVIVGVLLTMAGTVYAVYASFVQELPSAEEISRRSVETFETTRIYDRTGEHLLYEIMPPDGGRRTWVELEDIPEYLRNATIAMEDKNFYDETLYTNFYGINVEGVARAAMGELSGDDRGGGSSIPQQLVKILVFETLEERADRNYIRKLQEWILTFEIMRQNPGREGRDQILEAYLNNIFYGNFAHGIQAAAQTYFGKPVQELTLAESAMLVPIPQFPALNPIHRPEEAKRRQELVLDTMYLRGYVTAEEAWEAKQQPIIIAPPVNQMTSPHWVLYVRGQLEKRFGTDAVYGGGLQVITTIDLEIQREAERIAREHIGEIGQEREVHNAAVVIMETKTAQIVGMVGSLDYEDESIDGNVNMALAPRQPGSSFKPFVYATAFAQGYAPATMIMDIRTSFPNPPAAPYVPENYSRTFHGPVLLRQALGSSYNIPAVALIEKVGVMNAVETARAMGIEDLNAASYGLPIALGSNEVSLLDMVYAYSVFANNGIMLGESKPVENFRPGYRQLDPVSILQVTNSREEVIYTYLQPQQQSVLRPEVAYLINDVMSDNQARTPGFGSVNSLTLPDRPVAAKTGSTNQFSDGWTVGYTPQYVTGVWAGNADRTLMRNAPGARTAAPIWQRVMTYLHEGKPVESFERPPGLVTAVVDSTSGKLPTAYSAGRRQELFIEGTVPTTHDDVHIPFQICRASGLLATAYCPPEEVDVQVFQIYPPEADDWVREQGIPQPPTEMCDMHGPGLSTADVGISNPRPFNAVSGVVEIIGNARAGSQERFWLQIGQGLEPSAWTPITPEQGHHVDNEVLGTWDAHGLEGLYTLQLIVIDGGMHREVTVPLLVDNHAPTIQLINPNPDAAVYSPTPFARDLDRTYQIGYDEWVNIQAQAEDNVSIGRVEFFMNGHLVGTSTVAPYTVRVMMNQLPGGIGDREHLAQIVGPLPAFQTPQAERGTRAFIIHAVAYDTAGNRAVSQPVDAYVIPR